MSYRHLADDSDDEIERFSRGSTDPDRWRQDLRTCFAERTLRPEWCWQSLTPDGQVLAANYWWGRPGADVAHQLVSVLRSDVSAAADLVEHSRATMGLETAKAILSCGISDGRPIEQVHQAYAALLARTGFRASADRVRVEWDGHAVRVALRLSYQPARALPESDLVALIARVLEGSLDHSMQAGVLRRGLREHAHVVLADLMSYSGAADWFAVATRPDGVPVGYVVPATIDGGAVVAELGVSRDHRGRRYATDLLIYATGRLVAAGHTRIRADTDLANRPMRAAFSRAAYAEFAWRRDYTWDSAPVSASVNTVG